MFVKRLWAILFFLFSKSSGNLLILPIKRFPHSYPNHTSKRVCGIPSLFFLSRNLLGLLPRKYFLFQNVSKTSSSLSVSYSSITFLTFRYVHSTLISIQIYNHVQSVCQYGNEIHIRDSEKY